MSKDTPAEEVNKAQEEAEKRYRSGEQMIWRDPKNLPEGMSGYIETYTLTREAFIAGAKWQSSPPDAGKEQDAVEFIDWVVLEGWKHTHSWGWYLLDDDEEIKDGKYYTTSELYKLFQASQPPVEWDAGDRLEFGQELWDIAQVKNKLEFARWFRDK